MKLTFLGTAAAEGIPALWCECDVCAKAKERGGKELRRRCAYLIDDDTLVDFGPDAFWQTIEFKLDLLKIDRLIITHAHSDHLNPVDLHWRLPPYLSKVAKTITLIGTQPTFSIILNHIFKNNPQQSFEKLFIKPITAKAGVTITDGDMSVLPIPANHEQILLPMIYAIERKNRRVLIANDTGMLSDESWALLKGLRLDAAVIESTCGFKGANCINGHLGLNTTVAFRDRLREMGCLTPESQVITNHFSHNGGLNHPDMVETYGRHGITVAFDGMVIAV